MKKDDVKIGGTYLAKVSDKVVPVRIDAENSHGGWDATNLVTDKKVRIKNAQRLRCPCSRDGSAQAKPDDPAGTDDGAKKAKAKKASKKAKAEVNGEAKDKKLSCIDAAVKVLAEAGEPMNTKEMIEAMAAKGYWTSPGGKTPAGTLYSSILRELQVKKGEARFKKTERGKFALAR